MTRDHDHRRQIPGATRRVGKFALGLAAALGAGAWPMGALGQPVAPPLGNYECFTLWPLGPFGGFSLLPGGKYSVGRETGSYVYDSADRSIQWVGGPWSGGARPARYMGVNSSGPTIGIRWINPPPQRVIDVACHHRP
jgi:hypothetical protein